MTAPVAPSPEQNVHEWMADRLEAIARDLRLHVGGDEWQYANDRCSKQAVLASCGAVINCLLLDFTNDFFAKVVTAALIARGLAVGKNTNGQADPQ